MINHRRVKIIALMLTLVLGSTLALSACGKAGQSEAPQEEPASEVAEKALEEAPQGEAAAESSTKSLIVYFSHTGTTRGVSEYLHSVVGGDIVELEPVNPYPEGYSDALDPAKQEQRENARPEINNKIEDIDSYDVIYLGYPIWWGTMPMLCFTFLETYDFTGKTVVPYATSGGTGIRQSIEDLKEEIPDADVKEGLLVRSNDDIIPWLEEQGLK